MDNDPDAVYISNNIAKYYTGKWTTQIFLLFILCVTHSINSFFFNISYNQGTKKHTDSFWNHRSLGYKKYNREITNEEFEKQYYLYLR